MKPQKQNHPKERAKHGSPLYSKQFGFWCAPSMHAMILRNGGSEFVRDIILRHWNRQVNKGM